MTARGARRGERKGDACGCEATLDMLAAHGGPHARSVLRRHDTDVRFFSDSDWLQHMAEEERILGAISRAGRFPRAALARIRREHEMFRRVIAAGGKIRADVARAHAQYEDRQVERAGLSSGK